MEEILDETNQLDVSGKTKQWLQMEALNHNPKIEVGRVVKYFHVEKIPAEFSILVRGFLLKLCQIRRAV